MKNYFSKFKNQYICYAFIYCIAMVILHTWQYFDSDFRIEPLIRIITYGLLIILLLVFNSASWFCIGGFILSLAFLMYQDFTYYMAWFFALLCMDRYKNKKLVFLILYILAIGVVASLHHKQPSHIYIHFLNCGMMFFMEKQSREKLGLQESVIKTENLDTVKKLNLTNDERIIITELCNGKQQKDIPGFNKNTVSKKLQAAKERNQIKSLSELQYRFLKESDNN